MLSFDICFCYLLSPPIFSFWSHSHSGMWVKGKREEHCPLPSLPHSLTPSLPPGHYFFAHACSPSDLKLCFQCLVSSSSDSLFVCVSLPLYFCEQLILKVQE
eukprot:TRINITY_DN6619_c0_g1_i1.p1 TRINITY_DN6619_c0_g1~~TRINITY_DN6619_c0_g1_i1.p1  ORF type:complete len:102 (+),score=6.52 TRINITY_DN6619_c0_g1_i1:121-426(+)